MLNQALQFLLDTFISLFMYVVLLRFYMQVFRAPFHNPLSQFVVALTDFAVRPMRRVVPGVWGLDLASLVLAWLLEFVLLILTYWLNDFPFLAAGGQVFLALAFLALVNLLKISIYMIMLVVIVQAVLSWVSPYNQLMPVLSALSRPFTRLFSRFIPPIANIDLSPLFVIIACQLLLMLPVFWLERLALSLV